MDFRTETSFGEGIGSQGRFVDWTALHARHMLRLAEFGITPIPAGHVLQGRGRQNLMPRNVSLTSHGARYGKCWESMVNAGWSSVRLGSERPVYYSISRDHPLRDGASMDAVSALRNIASYPNFAVTRYRDTRSIITCSDYTVVLYPRRGDNATAHYVLEQGITDGNACDTKPGTLISPVYIRGSTLLTHLRSRPLEDFGARLSDTYTEVRNALARVRAMGNYTELSLHDRAVVRWLRIALDYYTGQHPECYLRAYRHLYCAISDVDAHDTQYIVGCTPYVPSITVHVATACLPQHATKSRGFNSTRNMCCTLMHSNTLSDRGIKTTSQTCGHMKGRHRGRLTMVVCPTRPVNCILCLSAAGDEKCCADDLANKAKDYRRVHCVPDWYLLYRMPGAQCPHERNGRAYNYTYLVTHTTGNSRDYLRSARRAGVTSHGQLHAVHPHCTCSHGTHALCAFVSETRRCTCATPTIVLCLAQHHNQRNFRLTVIRRMVRSVYRHRLLCSTSNTAIVCCKTHGDTAVALIIVITPLLRYVYRLPTNIVQIRRMAGAKGRPRDSGVSRQYGMDILRDVSAVDKRWLHIYLMD